MVYDKVFLVESFWKIDEEYYIDEDVGFVLLNLLVRKSIEIWVKIFFYYYLFV